MNTLNLISLLLLPFCTTANKIKIQIDSEDVLKLINSFMRSRAFRDVAAEIVQRSDLKRGIYNNPYHPEDDIVNESIEVEVKDRKNTETTKPNTPIDLNIEKDNENYILDAGHVSEDELDSNVETEKSTNHITTIAPTTIIKKITTKKYEKLNDLQNFKIMQKRFQLKSF